MSSLKQTSAVILLILAVMVRPGAADPPKSAKKTAAAAEGKGPRKLKYNLAKGHTYSLLSMTVMDEQQSIMGRSQGTHTVVDLGMKLKVDDVDKDGVAAITVNYTSVHYEQQGMLGDAAYDSTKDPKNIPPAAAPYAAMVGQSIQLKLGPLGHVKSVKGGDKLVQHILHEMPPDNGMLKGLVEEGIKDQFSEDGLKNIIESKLSIYPNKAVGIGDSWTRSTTVNRGMAMTADTKYTLKSIAGGKAVLSVGGSMSAAPAAGAVNVGDMKLNVSVSGTRKGTIEVDVETGWILDSTVEESFNGATTMEGGGQKVSLPMSGTTKMKLEGKK